MRKVTINKKRKLIQVILFTVSLFFFVIAFNDSFSPTSVQACSSHWCCGKCGTNGCVFGSCGGCGSCTCDGTGMCCDTGPCGTCNPPGCPSGYTTTNTGCSTTTTYCTRYNCRCACGSSSRTCWLLKYTVNFYAGTGGYLSGTTSQSICRGSNTSYVTAYANTGYHFVNWSTGGTTNPLRFTNVTSNINTTANFAINTYTITHDANGSGASCNPDQTINYGSASSSPSCTRTDYNLTDYSLTSGSCYGTFNTSTGTCSDVRSNMTITAHWELANSAPTPPPHNLLADGESTPAIVATTTPTFSAIFNDPDTGDYSETYQIQVNTASDFSGTMMWDSSLTGMSRTYEGNRTSNITYNGSALSLNGSTYYWRIRLADSHSLISDWSSVAELTMNVAPTVATGLLTQGETNPVGVTTATPYFSAIFNDPDTGDTATHYQIQVNTSSDFTGTTMWDSGLEAMAATANGARSPNITYAGTTLAFNGATYYWRIKFADEHGTVSPWSTESANFKMNEPPTVATNLLTENLTNPTGISTPTPKFSAIFNDPDIVDTSSYYQIQVNTNASFTGSTMWDSTKSSMATTDKGQRSPEISYNGSTLTPNGATYYWRIRFWDSVDSVSPWSTESSHFTMEANQTPTTPSELLVDGHANHPRVNNLTPVFSAIFNDPNTFDTSSYYQIQVNTQEDFAGTVMWDSAKSSMSKINKGERCADVTYAGSELTLASVTYYWRIRFWDANNAVSPWGDGYFITSGAYITYEGLLFDGNIKLD